MKNLKKTYCVNVWLHWSGCTGSALAWHPMVIRSHPNGYSKSCDLWSSFAPCKTWSSGGTALRRVGATASQLNLPSLRPLSVAGCGRRQLGAAHLATSVALLQVVEN